MKFTAEAWDVDSNTRWTFAGTSDETRIEANSWQDAIDKAFERFQATKHAMPRLRPKIMIVRCEKDLNGTAFKQQGFGFRARQEAIRWAG